MQAQANSLHFTTENFTARPALELWVEVKTARLRRETTPALDVLWIHLTRHELQFVGGYFVARATADHAGLSHLAHAEGPDAESAIIAVTRKVQRALAAEARAAKRRTARVERRREAKLTGLA